MLTHNENEAGQLAALMVEFDAESLGQKRLQHIVSPIILGALGQFGFNIKTPVLHPCRDGYLIAAHPVSGCH